MPHAPPSATRARVAAAFVFFLNGFGFASWVPRIPEIKAGLDLGAAELGLALLGVAAGALLAMPSAGWLIGRFGSRATTRLAMLGFLAAPLLLPLAPGLLSLALSFALVGVTAGALDVAMNAQGMVAERALERPILNGLHGMFSLGGMAGAALTAGALVLGLALLAHLAFVGVSFAVAGLLACQVMLSDAAQPDEAGGPTFALPDRSLLVPGGIAFSALLIEGAVADWSAVYLRESLAAHATVAAWAFAGFQLAMASGRFAGDRLVRRHGEQRVVVTGALIGGLVFAVALLLAQPIAAAAGFIAIGLGIACTFPITLQVVTRSSLRPGHAIAAVCTVGYTGFLLGPPTIGLLAEGFGLGAALSLLLALFALILLLGRHLAGVRDPRQAES
jgi:MFS family permease